MHKKAFILTIIGLALILILAAVPGLGQQAEKPGIPAPAPQAESPGVGAGGF
jgi:hypothetical protein